MLAAGCGGDDGGAPARSTTSATAAAATTTEADADVATDPSGGCGREADAPTLLDERPGDVPLTFDAAGTERTYRLGVPPSYARDTPAPLVLNLHGSGSNAVQASVYSDLPAAAAERGIITVTPDAVAGQWELTPTGLDDDFLAALVADVEGRYCVDRARVHVVGMSLGAYKAALTACRHPDVFASAALVTVELFIGDCDPLAVVAFHGTADAVAAYGEGGTVDPATTPNAGLPGARENMANWADAGGCGPEPELTDVGDDVVRHTYGGCDEGVDVVLHTIEGGGHTWPGSDIVIGDPSLTTATIDATALILDWFEDHPRLRR